jgi:pimeloyl-ACP methyl ester carboxylesterase
MRALLLLAAIATASVARAEPPPDQAYRHPARLVRVEGARRLNLLCLGRNAEGSPTVLFDSGLATGTMAWRLVQGEVAKVTRACAYDRAGIGFSDPRTGESDARAVVADLHALLVAAKIRTPILYVGHSIAGLYGVLLQATHPGDLAGAVLVDPSFADQFFAMSAGAPPAVVAAQLKSMQMQTKRLRECATLAAPLPDDCAGLSPTLPPALAVFRKAQESRPSYLLTDASEFESFTPGTDGKSLDQKELEAVPANFGDKPLVILTSSKSQGDPSLPAQVNAGIDRGWKAGHDRLATLSTRGSNTVVPQSGHNIQHDQPQAVIDAVLKAVAMVRGG